jgi:SAM-dependent methyltransferase
MLLRALPDPSGHRVLDIGAGASTLPAYLARKGGRVTALDLLDPYSAPLASIARRSNRHGVRLVLGSMLALPFADGTLDAVVSISAIEHLGHEKGRERVVPRNEFWSRTKVALAEMARVLRPSGLFYLTSEIYVEGRVEGDRWWGSLAEGSVVGAYPATAIGEIFLDPLRRLGIALEGGVDISPELLVADPDRSNFRDRFISTFCLVGRKRP